MIERAKPSMLTAGPWGGKVTHETIPPEPPPNVQCIEQQTKRLLDYCWNCCDVKVFFCDPEAHLNARWIIHLDARKKSREWIESQPSLKPLLEFERGHCGGEAVKEPLAIC